MFSSAVSSQREAFWHQVENTKSVYSPEGAVVVQGKMIAENAMNLQTEMYRACNKVDLFAQRFFSNPPRRVLDLGAGAGTNTLQMAKSGAHVTAIDQSKELLTDFSNESVVISCPSDNLRLRRGDITTMESYGGPFDLAVAIDILPYVHPTKLRSTLEKIHRCLDKGGLLIGTVFTTNDHPLIQELLGQVGAHYYENGTQFVSQLLHFSGFIEKELEEREEGGIRFIAEKKA